MSIRQNSPVRSTDLSVKILLLKKLIINYVTWSAPVWFHFEDGNCLVWMPPGQISCDLCVIHFWRVPFSHLMSLLLPSFLSLQCKELGYYGRLDKKVDIFCDKIILTRCKWSILDALGSHTLRYYTFQFKGSQSGNFFRFGAWRRWTKRATYTGNKLISWRRLCAFPRRCGPENTQPQLSS